MHPHNSRHGSTRETWDPQLPQAGELRRWQVDSVRMYMGSSSRYHDSRAALRNALLPYFGVASTSVMHGSPVEGAAQVSAIHAACAAAINPLCRICPRTYRRHFPAIRSFQAGSSSLPHRRRFDSPASPPHPPPSTRLYSTYIHTALRCCISPARPNQGLTCVDDHIQG